MKEDIIKNAPLYNRKDWLYIFSNGKEGTNPAGYASRYYNYAGQLVSRSGWTKDDQWSFFDVGPTGVNGHQHYDKLHISTYAYGRPLLVDNGRFTHKWDNWRQYFIQSFAHNDILINGKSEVVFLFKSERSV